MFKTILVPTGGDARDDGVFETALALGRPFLSHLEFFHVNISASEAAVYAPHADYVLGAATRDMLATVARQSEERSKAAREHVRAFCQRSRLPLLDHPTKIDSLSASWREADGDAVRRLIGAARHRDLVVVGRQHVSNGLPADVVELLLLGCGRPVVLAPEKAPPEDIATVLVCWKETPEAARALAAAMPLLENARQVIIASAPEGGASDADALRDLVAQLRWHKVTVEMLPVHVKDRSIADSLLAAARDCTADLMVLGAYGHNRTRELLFGGVTQALLDHADIPVFMLH